MKRSDLVYQISDNVLINFYPEVSLRIRNLIADMMLAEVEKNGMKPPTWLKITHKYSDDDKPEHINILEEYSNEWEPES